MTIFNALTFIKRGMSDAALRSTMNKTSDPVELQTVLAREKLLFSFFEFDEAFHFLLFQCQEESQADQLKSFRLWWELLSNLPESVTCS